MMDIFHCEPVSTPGTAPHRGWVWLGWMPLLLCLPVSYGLWRLYYPGLFSFDSIEQVKQAVAGKFSDTHPPIMAIVLSLILKAGGQVAQLMLAQCAAGVLGIFFLAYEALQLVFGARLSAAQMRWCALLVLLILLSPLSPLSFYLMTFWKDVWLMISLFWLGGISLSLFRLRSTRLTRGLVARLVAFLLLSTLACLSRHNALVILPVCCLLYALFLWPAVPRYVALAACVLPVLCYGGAKYTQDKVYAVQHTDLWALGFELVGLCIRCPEAKAELPYTASCLAKDCRDHYYFGWIDLSVGAWAPTYMCKPAEIRREYWIALCKFPLAMLRLKLQEFRFHLVRNPCGRFEANGYTNQFGIVLNHRFAVQREYMRRHVDKVFEHPLLQWLFTRHVVWLAIDAMALIALSVHWLMRRSRLALQLAVLLAVPTAYYLSFCLISISGEFRYMYPASLCIQIPALAMLAGAAALWLDARRGRGRHRNEPLPGVLTAS